MRRHFALVLMAAALCSGRVVSMRRRRTRMRGARSVTGRFTNRGSGRRWRTPAGRRRRASFLPISRMRLRACITGWTWITGRCGSSYERPDAPPDRALSGRQLLLYYLGSGRRGRTWIYQREGYWYEIPINWYAKKHMWDMTPHFLQARSMPFTLPVDPGCLHCHASDVQASLPEARNKFAGPPFPRGGITCEACHGDPARHLASGGREPMLDPAKLAPIRRASICLECHLEGEVAVVKQGHNLGEFRPGDNLFDEAAYFEDGRKIGAEGRATSQWESLLESACKRASGERLTCTTCHDPHATVAAENRVAYYRARCLACHTGTGERASRGESRLHGVPHAAAADGGHCARAGDGSSDSDSGEAVPPRERGRGTGCDWGERADDAG